MSAFGKALLECIPKAANQKIEFRSLNIKLTPFGVFARLQSQFERAYILESLVGPRKLAEYSFLGFDPRLTMHAKEGKLSVVDKFHSVLATAEVNDPLEGLSEVLGRPYSVLSSPRLIGGAVGYVSYDAVRRWERLPTTIIQDGSLFPDTEFSIYDDGMVYDHKSSEFFYYHRGVDRSREIEEVANSSEDSEVTVSSEPRLNVSKERFEEMVVSAKNYIEAGDIFQVVLSKRYSFKLKGDLLDFYEALRRINPSPYMYFMKMGERKIVGSSPEMLIRVSGRKLETFPIAGTRPITTSIAENRRLSKELMVDKKEKAEHVMLVDLARNDLGRVSEHSSVRVSEFAKLHRFSHVQHIVSRVVGDLKEKLDSRDVFRAVFPAGTVSGAPKVRAMEIIEELENTRRGPYGGAVGYFSYNGNADFAITIRSLVVNGDRGYVQTGAGIVADSVPEKEWMETEAKAKAMMTVLRRL